MSKKAIVGLVSTYAAAEQTVAELKRSGFTADDVSVLFPDTRGTRDFAYENNTKSPEGAAVGAGLGGALGGTIGLLAGVGALAIPGLGAFIAAGPLMAALSGAAAGGAVGGLTGALVGMGIPEVEAKAYEGKVKNGGILVSVHTEDQHARARAKEVLVRAGANDVMTMSEVSA
jgi:hypothetical protein